MLRSMNSAISGLKNHQVFMDVIGNNIANINTTGFKASRITFQTMLSQTLRGAITPAVDHGGVNTMQVGLGAALGAIDMINTQGTMTNTSKLTDMAIAGDGFFVLTDGFQRYFTRDGSFDISADSSLVSTSTGLRVMGWNATFNAGTGDTTINNSVPPTSPITIPVGLAVAARATKNINFTGNLNGGPTDRVGSGIVEAATEAVAGTPTSAFAINAGDTITFTYGGVTYTTGGLAAAAANTSLATVQADIQTVMRAAGGAATADITVTVVDDAGTLGGEATLGFQGGKALKFGNSPSSNGNLSTALKNREMKGLETMTSSMAVYDSLGNAHEITIRFDKIITDPTAVPPAAVDNAWRWTVANLDPGTSIDTIGTNGGGTGLVKFDRDGAFLSVSTTNAAGDTNVKQTSASITLDYSNGATPDQAVVLDFSKLTQLQDGNSARATLNDGFATGTMTGFIIGKDGVIKGTFTNGVNRDLGQIAVATFPNPGGLKSISQNLHVESANSGIPSTGTPATANRGDINAGQLELSNVDLAEQFSDMIRAERGFQANSRIITTSDEMLQDLVSLKR